MTEVYSGYIEENSPIKQCPECSVVWCTECIAAGFECEDCGDSFCENCTEGMEDVPCEDTCRLCFEDDLHPQRHGCSDGEETFGA